MKSQAAVGSGQREARGMNQWAKLTLVTLCTFLVSAFMSGGWCGPKCAQAAATYQATGAVVSGTAALTVVWPVHQVDDVALLFVESANEAVTTPSGFTAVANSPQSTGTAAAIGATRLSVFWARATSAAMPNVAVADSGNHTIAAIVTFRGVANTGNPVEASAGSVKTPATTTTTFPTVTTTTAGALIVLAAATDYDIGVAVWSAFTNANLGGLAERVDASTTSGVGGGLGIATGTFAGPGATGTSSGTLTSSITAQMTIALKPYVFVPVSSSPLLHNSVNLDPTNEKGYGVWGVAGGTYGEFVCETCHSSSTTGPNGNVKKVVASIPATIGTAVVKPVTFYNMTGFGDDSVSHATSTKICEVCHTQTTAHQYNTANSPQSGNLTHANGDCMQCHPHSDGFKASGHLVPLYATTDGHASCASGIGCHTNSSNPAAPYPALVADPVIPPDCRTCHAKADPTVGTNGCGSCHGAANGTGEPIGTVHPDAAGSHSVHTPLTTCVSCHDTGGTGADANHGRGNKDTNPAVVNLTAAYTWTGTTCTTASCHANVYGTGSAPSPAWGTPAGCEACHSAYPIGINGPVTGSHALTGHTVSCTSCHASGTTATSIPSSGHADGNIDVANVGYPATVTKHAAGSGYTTCSAASCHANVYGTGNVTTPAWGATPTGSCSICHNTQPITASGPATGSHAVHAGKACTLCHAAGTAADSAPTTGHIDGNIDVVNISYTANIAKHAAGTGYSTCSNIACHSPYATPVNSATWGGGAGSLTCEACHPKDGLSGAHKVHMGVLDLTSGSVFYNMTANRSPAIPQVSETVRNHGFGCAECHPMDKATFHLNGTIDVDLASVAGVGVLRSLNAATAAYDQNGTKKCSNIYCHSNASRIEIESNVSDNTSLAWNDMFSNYPLTDRCAYCHGNQPTTGAHKAHSVGIHTFNEVDLVNGGVGIVIDGNIFNGVSGKVPIVNKPNTAHGNPANSTTIGCYICHYATVTSKANDKNYKCVVCHYTGNSRGAQLKGLASISNLKNHVNGVREIVFEPVKVLSKAQIRPKGPNKTNSTFDFYSGAWTRTSYKNMTTLSFDKAKVALNTAVMWHYSSPKESSCSNISCHNGNHVKWNLDNFNDPNKCMDCHNAL